MIYSTPRSLIVSLRNYHHFYPSSNTFESWEAVVLRVIKFQEFLWQRALERELRPNEKEELKYLKFLISRKFISCSGRHLALSDTKNPYNCGFFNSTFTLVKTIDDLVDIFWLMLNGCGTGFYPGEGEIKGFNFPLENIFIEEECLINHSQEHFDPNTKTWTIILSDTALSLVNGLKYLLLGKYRARSLILKINKDLKNFNFKNLIYIFTSITKILSKRLNEKLKVLDIVDIVNLLGLIPFKRKSSQVAIFNYEDKLWLDVLDSRKDNIYYKTHCNISILLDKKLNIQDLKELFIIIKNNEGSQPGLINRENALKNAPWFSGVDSCVTSLLPDKGVCCLSEINLPAFQNDFNLLKKAVYIAARMNYRQTFLDLDDGVLQKRWNINNQFLRLCGIGLTGVAHLDLSKKQLKILKNIAHLAIADMAKGLGSICPQLATCIKPSGNLSKTFGSSKWGEVSEGIHMPLGRYVFNKVSFRKEDPLLPTLSEANYEIHINPQDENSVLVNFPIKYNSKLFFQKDSAINQLERYKKMLNYWSDHNVSNTIFYKYSEVDQIVRWLNENWSMWIGISFCLINNTENYAYLPQEKVCKTVFYNYSNSLKEIKISYEYT